MLGVHVDALTIPEITERIAASIAAQDHRLLGAHNLHSIHLYQRNASVRSFYDTAQYIPIDSMALVLLARLLGYRVTRDHRATSLDWIDPVLEAAVRNNWRVFYYGSRPGVIDDGANAWRTRHPGLQLATAQGPPRGGSETSGGELLNKIRAWSPHILFGGTRAAPPGGLGRRKLAGRRSQRHRDGGRLTRLRGWCGAAASAMDRPHRLRVALPVTDRTSLALASIPRGALVFVGPDRTRPHGQVSSQDSRVRRCMPTVSVIMNVRNGAETLGRGNRQRDGADIFRLGNRGLGRLLHR